MTGSPKDLRDSNSDPLAFHVGPHRLSEALSIFQRLGHCMQNLWHESKASHPPHKADLH
jgi:hypothetical protein